MLKGSIKLNRKCVSMKVGIKQRKSKGIDKYVDYHEPEPCFGAWNGRFSKGGLFSIAGEVV